MAGSMGPGAGGNSVVNKLFCRFCGFTVLQVSYIYNTENRKQGGSLW